MFHKVYSFIAVIMVFVNINVCVWRYRFISVHVYCTCSAINNLQWTKKRQNQNVPVAKVKGSKIRDSLLSVGVPAMFLFWVTSGV